MAGDADSARKVARSATSAPVTNVIAVEPVTILLDLPVLADDDFLFTPSDGKPVAYSYKAAEGVDAFHSKIVLPVKQKSSVTYTLAHRRAGKAVQTLFKGVKGSELVAKSAAPPFRYKTLQSYTLVTETPHDPDLRSPFPNYSKLVKSGPQIIGAKAREQNKDSAAVKTAYDRATAVISRRCRFVEWNFFTGSPGDAAGTSPFTYHTERGHDSYEGSWSEIEGERWIYVYRRPATGGEFDQPEWIDEFHRDAKGQLSSVQNGAQALGSTVCFARRIRGVAQEYYFFATRFRLPDEAAKDLRHLIARFSVPVNFEVNDRGLADFHTPALSVAEMLLAEGLIPVLDPLTVGLNLHRCAIAAIDDCINYASIFAEQSAAAHKAADRRLKKNLLGHLIKLIADADPKARDLLKDDGDVLKKFLLQFEMQVKYRNSIREVWSNALVKWLRGEPIRWLAKVYLSPAVFKKSFDQFFSFWGNAIYGLTETNAGKNFLGEVIADKSHWVHAIALGGPGYSNADLFGLYRKLQGPGLVVGTELGKIFAFRGQQKSAVEAIEHAINQINGTTGVKHITVSEPMVAFTTASGEIKSVPSSQWKLNVEGQLEAELTGAGEGLHGPSRKKISLLVSVECMNLYLAGQGIFEGWKDATGEQKAFAVLNLFGSGLDFSATLLDLNKASFEAKLGEEAIDTGSEIGKFFRKAETIAMLGFVSSSLDVLTGFGDTVDAINKKNAGAALGSGIATVGSFVSASATLWSLAPLVEAGPIGLVGAALIGLGTFIKVFWGAGQSDYQRLVAHCQWGKDSCDDAGEKPSWSRYPFGKWPGNYNAQLEAAVSLLCAPRLAPDPKDHRYFQLDIDWFPPGCKLDVFYDEIWDPPGAHPPMRGVFVMSPQGAVAQSGILSMKPGASSGYRVGPAGKVPLDPIVDIDGRTFAPDGLKKLTVGVVLEINSGKYRFRFPAGDSGRVYKTLYEAD